MSSYYLLFPQINKKFISQDNVYGWGEGWGYLMQNSYPTHFTSFLTELSIGLNILHVQNSLRA